MDLLEELHQIGRSQIVLQWGIERKIYLPICLLTQNRLHMLKTCFLIISGALTYQLINNIFRLFNFLDCMIWYLLDCFYLVGTGHLSPISPQQSILSKMVSYLYIFAGTAYIHDDQHKYMVNNFGLAFQMFICNRSQNWTINKKNKDGN